MSLVNNDKHKSDRIAVITVTTGSVHFGLLGEAYDHAEPNSTELSHSSNS
jgi:hypothetical protein